MLAETKLKLYRSPFFSGAQLGVLPTAPLFLSTPFRRVRYQKLASLAERCRNFWRESTRKYEDRCKIWFFSVSHKKSTAFLVRIRDPPINLILSNFRLIGGTANGWKPS